MRGKYLLIMLVLTLAVFAGCRGKSVNTALIGTVLINEFMASNVSANEDNFGEKDDWIELYNNTDDPIDVGGMFITDNLGKLTKYQIPKTNSSLTTIQPRGHLLLWADKDPEQGILHLPFKLTKEGEEIGIVAEDAITLIDSYVFGLQTTDFSWGRTTDGASTWTSFTTPTPGTSNQ